MRFTDIRLYNQLFRCDLHSDLHRFQSIYMPISCAIPIFFLVFPNNDEGGGRARVE